MNDSVLRGFCQHGSVLTYSLRSNEWIINLPYEEACELRKTKCDVQPVLSPSQIIIVFEYLEEGEHRLNMIKMLPKILKDEPFLVATILRDSGEKEREYKGEKMIDEWGSCRHGIRHYGTHGCDGCCGVTYPVVKKEEAK